MSKIPDDWKPLDYKQWYRSMDVKPGVLHRARRTLVTIVLILIAVWVIAGIGHGFVNGCVNGNDVNNGGAQCR